MEENESEEKQDTWLQDMMEHGQRAIEKEKQSEARQAKFAQFAEIIALILLLVGILLTAIIWR